MWVMWCIINFLGSTFQETQSAVLKDDAIPTIFDAPSQPQNVQVKRSKETVSKINFDCFKLRKMVCII